MGMSSREIVKRAVEFRTPPRLPFWQHEDPDAPDDVCDIWEMDRGVGGWFFDHAVTDDWGCVWSRTEMDNMGQVTGHPLADWTALDGYRPPDPCHPGYFAKLDDELTKAGDRYVVVTSHFTLLERLHMLRGFAATMEDFYLEPERVETMLDLVLEFKLAQFAELHRRAGDRVDGLFMTDDWGTQQGTFVGPEIFDRFFADRYRTLFGALHGYGWHVILHSCGRVNAFVPRFIDVGVDMLNMQQPRAYGLVEFGESFKGQVAFLTTADIQATLPTGDARAIREEVELLIRHWSTPAGGFVVFNYGDPAALAVRPEMSTVMFDAFREHMHYWDGAVTTPSP